MYIFRYKTQEKYSDLLMVSDGEYLTGLIFEGSKDMAKICSCCEERSLPVFEDTIKWLDIYFSGRDPGFVPRMKFTGISGFRAEVMEIVMKIPFGTSLSYGDIGRIIAERRGIIKMSARAVGGAVGSNPICLIVPCHRVLGATGKLTGYGGGLENKKALLMHEGIAFHE